MGAPLDKVFEVLDMLKSQDTVFADSKIPTSLCKYGIIQASIVLGKEFPMTTTTSNDSQGNPVETVIINADITDKELYLAGLYAYRNYATKTHDEATKRATNFKTISFAISGATERAKEFMRIVWWCDNEIKATINALASSMGVASEMVGD